MTSNWGYDVLRWSQDSDGTWTSQLLHLADKPIEHAEPDPEGRRLLLVEDLGARNIRGFLYSLVARDEWLDLGSEYKWLGIGYLKSGEILVAHSGIADKVIRLPTLESLVQDAQDTLPNGCLPKLGNDFRSSPCWPTWL